jgi:AcrR family transcriptional regulator
MPDASTTAEEPARKGRRPGKPDTRAQILESARRMVAAGGCSGTSMRAIARDAGVDNALVVHYFGSREGLLREVLEAEAAETPDFRALVARHGVDDLAEPLLREILSVLGKGCGERPSLLAVLIGMGMDAEVASSMLADVLRSRWTGPLGDALRDAGVPEPELAAETTALLLLGLAVTHRTAACPRMQALDDDAFVAWHAPMLREAFAPRR